MDQDSVFMSSLLNCLFKKFYMKIKTVIPNNHHSQAEHGKKALFPIMTKHLTDLGQMLPKYLSLAALAHNTFKSPNLEN